MGHMIQLALLRQARLLWARLPQNAHRAGWVMSRLAWLGQPASLCAQINQYFGVCLSQFVLSA